MRFIIFLSAHQWGVYLQDLRVFVFFYVSTIILMHTCFASRICILVHPWICILLGCLSCPSRCWFGRGCSASGCFSVSLSASTPINTPINTTSQMEIILSPSRWFSFWWYVFFFYYSTPRERKAAQQQVLLMMAKICCCFLSSVALHLFFFFNIQFPARPQFQTCWGGKCGHTDKKTVEERGKK